MSPVTLIPRPETEYLVELVIHKLKDKKSDELNICDIGTGCGCIAIVLAMNFNSAKIIATDISEKALILAKENSVLHNIEHRIGFLKSDLFENVNDKFDLIISNPPYVAESEKVNLEPEILNYEPITALIASDNGFAVIKRLINEAPNFLQPNGLLAIEIGDKHGKKVLLEVEKSKEYKKGDVVKDLNGLDRYFFGKIN